MKKATLTPAEAMEIAGIGKNNFYELLDHARKTCEPFTVCKIHSKYIIPKKPFMKALNQGRINLPVKEMSK